MDAIEVAANLTRGLLSPGEIRDLVPSEPGLYSWWGRPGCLPGISGPTLEQAELLYVGIASNLRKRLIGNHLAPRSGSSTLRRSLAALLMLDQGWSTQRTSRVVLLPADEERLTQWMGANLLISFTVAPDPQSVEGAVISLLAPPLNLAKNARHPLRNVMVEARRAWHRSADNSLG